MILRFDVGLWLFEVLPPVCLLYLLTIVCRLQSFLFRLPLIERRQRMRGGRAAESFLALQGGFDFSHHCDFLSDRRLTKALGLNNLSFKWKSRSYYCRLMLIINTNRITGPRCLFLDRRRHTYAATVFSVTFGFWRGFNHQRLVTAKHACRYIWPLAVCTVLTTRIVMTCDARYNDCRSRIPALKSAHRDAVAERCLSADYQILMISDARCQQQSAENIAMMLLIASARLPATSSSYLKLCSEITWLIGIVKVNRWLCLTRNAGPSGNDGTLAAAFTAGLLLSRRERKTSWTRVLQSAIRSGESWLDQRRHLLCLVYTSFLMPGDAAFICHLDQLPERCLSIFRRKMAAY